MTAIRPNAFPAQVQPSPTPAQDAAKLAAQRAFFAAAMGQAQPAGEPPEPTARDTATPVVRATTHAETPQKIPRPGSLFDIRV